jgi:YD repeat-containing protein
MTRPPTAPWASITTPTGTPRIGVWDVENHLVSQTLDGQAVTLTYDAAGKRIRRDRLVNGQPEWIWRHASWRVRRTAVVSDILS